MHIQTRDFVFIRIMRVFLFVLLTAVSSLSLMFPSYAGAARTFEAALPSEISTSPDLCAYAPCKDVMPLADTFSLRKGNPSYVEAYQTIEKEIEREEEGEKETKHIKEKRLVGYVFLSTDIVDIPAYSGKPVVTLIGMDTQGIITGMKILRHSEPILMVGIPEEELTKFIKQYSGNFVGDKIEIGKAREKGGYIGVDAISGATVTVIAENRTIMRSGFKIAKQVGIIKPKPRAPLEINQQYSRLDWDALVKEGSIERLVITPRQVKAADKGRLWMDLYFGYLNQPSLGKNILGERGYESLLQDLSKGDQALFIIGNGEYSFKGSGFVRGAIFDRIQISQEDETYTFTDKDYYALSDLPIKGVPDFNEGGIFIIRKGAFDPAYPWNLVVLTTTRKLGVKEKEFFTFSNEYILPEKYVVGERIIVREEAPWVGIWKANIPSIIFLSVYLLIILILFTWRFKLVQRRRVAKWARYGIMAVSLFFIGFYTLAQPSITQFVTLIHKFIDIFQGFPWGLFLTDPIIFILWWFIALTVIIWGRGVFCGWICAYGVLTEFSYRMVHFLFPKILRYEFPYRIHKKLVYVKYGIFIFLVIVSFYSIESAERYAEVEPFKSAFLVGPFHREWPYVVYFVVLFIVCIISYRFFCKYLCPLGAGLALPTLFSLFHIKRRVFCSRCTICARECGVGAIDEKGVIDKKECLRCLECEENFWDSEKCPPLVVIKKEKGRALTEEEKFRGEIT